MKTASFKAWQNWLLLSSLLIFFLVSLVYRFYHYYQKALVQTDLSHQEFSGLLAQARTLPVKQTNGKSNFLLLGTDAFGYRNENNPLTDTIILGSLDFSTGTVSLLSLPRDIYLPEFNSKINSLYSSAYKESSQSALAETTEKIGQIFQLPLHYSAVVNLQDVHDFISLLGGVKVEVERSFTDERYPRDDININLVHDPKLLYQTISFESGEQLLNADRAIQFIRSRHGDNQEGNDYARSARQQKVLQSLAQTVLQRVLNDLKNLDFTFFGQLYRFYQTHYGQQIPFVEVLALGRDFLWQGKNLNLQAQSLRIQPGEANVNLQEEEASWRNGQQWSLRIINRENLIQEVHEKLHLATPVQP